MVHVFRTLPYGSLPLMSYINMKRASDHLQNRKDIHDNFPVPRIFPKGTIGMYKVKSLHDDENGALSPSIWASVVGHDDTVLTFYGVNFEVSFVTSTHRFCWFMGWVPHKSSFESTNNYGDCLRINHSSYFKPEIEQLALAYLHQKNYRKTLSTIKSK